MNPKSYPLKFKTSETYEIVTPESAEQGDAEERGFIFQDEYYTFRELVRLMQGSGYCYASSSEIDERTWFTVENYSENYQTGAIENRSIHIEMSSRNKKRLARAAGIEGAGRIKL